LGRSAHLAGTATWHYQREQAELICATVPGVHGITDEIALVPVPAPDDIQQSIISAYRRNASFTRQLVSVDALASGIVILSGAVTSWGEHDGALATAWSAPGVTRVDDRIMLAS
jgi:osmotically-inducible protein OsmY